MTTRSASIALAAVTLFAACRATERDASVQAAKRDTTFGAAGAAPDSPRAVVPSATARCGMPEPLQCADRAYLAFFEHTAASLVPGYRLPSEPDSKYAWRLFDSFVYQTRDDSDSTKAPYWTKGDVNNDGTSDFAYILIRVTDGAKALFAFMSRGDRYAVVALEEAFEDEMGLATQQRGSFTTAAGEGYGRPSPDEPAVVHVEKHAIAFFLFEGASSLFVWDGRAQRFLRVWLSD